MARWQRLNLADFKTMAAQRGAQVVDIRDAASFAAGHIPGARPLNDANLRAFLDSADKTQALVVCCYHGHSSQNVAAFLAGKDFHEVYSLDGGYVAWAAQH